MWRRNPDNPYAEQYAILDTLEKYRGPDGSLEFQMRWPKDPELGVQHWKQTSNPYTHRGKAHGMELISQCNQKGDALWERGLYSGNGRALLCSDSGGSWMYSVGEYGVGHYHEHHSSQKSGGRIPGPGWDHSVLQVELYARDSSGGDTASSNSFNDGRIRGALQNLRIAVLPSIGGSTATCWKLAPGEKAKFKSNGWLLEDYDEATEGFVTRTYMGTTTLVPVGTADCLSPTDKAALATNVKNRGSTLQNQPASAVDSASEDVVDSDLSSVSVGMDRPKSCASLDGQKNVSGVVQDDVIESLASVDSKSTSDQATKPALPTVSIAGCAVSAMSEVSKMSESEQLGISSEIGRLVTRCGSPETIDGGGDCVAQDEYIKNARWQHDNIESMEVRDTIITKIDHVRRPVSTLLDRPVTPGTIREVDFEMISVGGAVKLGIQTQPLALGKDASVWQYSSAGELLADTELLHDVATFQGPDQQPQSESILNEGTQTSKLSAEASAATRVGDPSLKLTAPASASKSAAALAQEFTSALPGGKRLIPRPPEHPKSSRSGDLIRMTVNRVQNSLTFSKNNRFVGKLRGLPADGDLFAAVSLSAKSDSVRLVNPAVTDTEAHHTELKFLKSERVSKALAAFDSVNRVQTPSNLDIAKKEAREKVRCDAERSFEVQRAEITQVVATEAVRRRRGAEKLWDFRVANPEASEAELDSERRRFDKWYSAHLDTPNSQLVAEVRPALRILHTEPVLHDEATITGDEREKFLEAALSLAKPELAALVKQIPNADFVDAVKDILVSIPDGSLSQAVVLAAAGMTKPSPDIASIAHWCVSRVPSCLDARDSGYLGPLDRALKCRNWTIAKVLIDGGAGLSTGSELWLEMAKAIHRCRTTTDFCAMMDLLHEIVVEQVQIASSRLQATLEQEHRGNEATTLSSSANPDANDYVPIARLPVISLFERLRVVGRFLDVMLLGPSTLKEHGTPRVLSWLSLGDMPDSNTSVKPDNCYRTIVHHALARIREIESAVLAEAWRVASLMFADVASYPDKDELKRQISGALGGMRDVYDAVDRLMALEEPGDSDYRKVAKAAAISYGERARSSPKTAESITELVLNAASCSREFHATMHAVTWRSGCGTYTEGDLARPSAIVADLVLSAAPKAYQSSNSVETAPPGLALFERLPKAVPISHGTLAAVNASEALKLHEALGQIISDGAQKKLNVVTYVDGSQQVASSVEGWRDESYLLALTRPECEVNAMLPRGGAFQVRLVRERMLVCRERLARRRLAQHAAEVIAVLKLLGGGNAALAAELESISVRDEGSERLLRQIAVLHRELCVADSQVTRSFSKATAYERAASTSEREVERIGRRVTSLQSKLTESDQQRASVLNEMYETKRKLLAAETR